MLASSLALAALRVLLYTDSSVAQALPLQNEREAHTNTSAKVSTVTIRVNSTYLPTTTITAFTFVTPFLSAKPIPITSQGQIVTTYLPLYTVCPAAPYQMPSMLPNATGASGTSATGLMARKRQADPSATPYYPLYNTSTPSVATASTSCWTAYSTVTTSICHTTLTPAFDFPTTITDCNEKVTFSRNHELATRSDGSAELMTSEYAVLWSSATAGMPSGTIEARVCHSTGDCSTHLETWRPVVETATASSSVPVTINSIVSSVSASSNNLLTSIRRHLLRRTPSRSTSSSTTSTLLPRRHPATARTTLSTLHYRPSSVFRLLSM